MRAVFSHWDKPFQKYGGGYKNPRHFLISLSFSATLAKKWFGSVVMYCDRYSVPMMESLNIFDEVIPCYEELAKVPEKHWAVAKMLVYSKQTEPFLHIDNDVFLLKPPPKRIFTGELVAQSIESNGEFGGRYLRQMEAMERTAIYPKYWVRDWDNVHFEEAAPFAYCAGILGGCNTELIRDYAITGIEHIKKYGHQYPDINTTIEQVYFAMMAFKTHTPVTTIISNWNETDECKKVGYRHFWGGTKRLVNPLTNKPYMEEVAEELAILHPSIMETINKKTQHEYSIN